MKYIIPFIIATVLIWLTVFVNLTPEAFAVVAAIAMIGYCYGVIRLIPLLMNI